MQKDDLYYATFIWLCVMFCLFMVLSLVYSSDLSDIKQLTGHTVTSLQTLKANCEKSLPRDKQCQLFVVASTKEDK